MGLLRLPLMNSSLCSHKKLTINHTHKTHARLNLPNVTSYYNLSNVCLFVCPPTPLTSLVWMRWNLVGVWRLTPELPLWGWDVSKASTFTFIIWFQPKFVGGGILAQEVHCRGPFLLLTSKVRARRALIASQSASEVSKVRVKRAKYEQIKHQYTWVKWPSHIIYHSLNIIWEFKFTNKVIRLR